MHWGQCGVCGDKIVPMWWGQDCAHTLGTVLCVSAGDRTTLRDSAVPMCWAQGCTHIMGTGLCLSVGDRMMPKHQGWGLRCIHVLGTGLCPCA